MDEPKTGDIFSCTDRLTGKSVFLVACGFGYIETPILPSSICLSGIKGYSEECLDNVMDILGLKAGEACFLSGENYKEYWDNLEFVGTVKMDVTTAVETSKKQPDDIWTL